jgi:hypothetical protein
MQFFTGAMRDFSDPLFYDLTAANFRFLVICRCPPLPGKQQQHFSDKQQLELPDKYINWFPDFLTCKNLFCNILVPDTASCIRG